MKTGILAMLLLFNSGSILAQAGAGRPNIIIILADDLGWADLGCYGSTFYETPNLDRLAAEGIRFTHAYSSSPVCSPTRAALMTGKNPVSTGVTDWIPGRQAGGKARSFEKLLSPPTAYQLENHETTLAEYATSFGYKTFFSGKWHLGEDEKHWPEYQGFQTNRGGWSKGGPTGRVNDSTGGYFTPYQNPRLTDGPSGEYLTDRLTRECVDFIAKNGSDPFLLFFSLYAVHNPLQAPAALMKKYQEKTDALSIAEENRFIKDESWMDNEAGWRRRLVQDNPVYAAMIENMDTNLGRIFEELRNSGLDTNTLIVFTSDNGGLSTAEGSPTSNTPLRNGKGWLHEGGIRVPLIMYWKGRIMSGSVSDVAAITTDLFSTIATAINPGYSKGKDVEGENIFSLLAGERNKSTRRDLFWHYPHYSNQGGKPGSAVRRGTMKLIYEYADGSIELYNLADDPGEQNNLAAKEAKQAKRLKKDLMNWLKRNDATIPLVNSSFAAK